MSEVLKLPGHPALPRIGLLDQVFRLHHADKIGSGFTITVRDRQYFVTAAHVVEGLEESNILELAFKDGYAPFKVLEIHRPIDGLDVAILRLDSNLYSWPDANYDSAGLFLGCECGFLGFPFGLSAEGLADSKGWPLPFLKKGWLAGSQRVSEKVMHFFLDGHNNKGFSGGPVFFVNSSTEVTHIFGVVSGFRREVGETPASGVPTDVMVNAGIVVCHPLMPALVELQKG